MLTRMTASIFRRLLALALTSVALCAALASPKHEPHVAASAAPPAVQVPDLRGTKDHPILVAVAPDEGKESDDHTLANWTVALGVATIALAIIGGLQLWLVKLQLRLMKDGSKDTELAARAANKAALAAEKSANVAEKSLYDLERPFIVVDIPVAGLTVRRNVNGPTLQREDMTLAINNYGRTPAILTELQCDIQVRGHGENIPPVDPDNMRGRALPAGVLAVSGKPFHEITSFALWNMNFTDGIINNTQSVWVNGFVRYKDVFGKLFVSGFCLVFNPFRGEFVRRGDHLRNYTREEREALQGEQPDAP